MFDKIEQILPHWAIAAIVIGVGVGVIMYRGSDYTVCNSQQEQLIRSEQKFIAGENYKVFFERCLASNRPGGCAPYFKGMRDLMGHLGGYVEDVCVQTVIVENKNIQRIFYSFLLHVTRLAWGDEGPVSVYSRQSWLDVGHLKTFCSVKVSFQNYFGMQTYNEIEKGIIEKLPEGNSKNRFVEKKEKTLLGIPCNQYL